MNHNYDIVIIGGGVQGLSLAYNLAKNNFGSIAVIEKSYIGSGASGRNGEMLRSAFASKEWIQFFNISMQLWEKLSKAPWLPLRIWPRNLYDFFRVLAVSD